MPLIMPLIMQLSPFPCTPNYACIKTGNLYMTNRVNGCCEGQLSRGRSWDDEANLNRWNLNVHFAKKVSTFVFKRQNGNNSFTNVWYL